jgi:hypothetical protein
VRSINSHPWLFKGLWLGSNQCLRRTPSCIRAQGNFSGKSTLLSTITFIHTFAISLYFNKTSPSGRQQDGHLRCVDDITLASEGEVRDENRHREADAAEEPRAEDVLPVEVEWQTVNTKRNGDETEQSYSYRLTNKETRNNSLRWCYLVPPL